LTGVRARSHHEIDPEHFAILAAGGGDDRVVAPFWRSERSWRLTVLRSLLDACAGVPEVTGPLPSLDTVLGLLSAAYQADPGACEDVLAQPQVGVWAAYTLREAGESRPAAALWPDLGYLHALAVACAVRAGIPCELALPVRHGTVVVPTVGAAVFPGRASHVRASYDGKVLTLDDGVGTVLGHPDDPRWREPVRVETGPGGLSVLLLDHDAYRDLRRASAPRPLEAAEVERWRVLIGDAWRILAGEQPERARAIAASLRTLVPVSRRAPYRQLSASGAEAFGGILLSEPDNATQLAVTLVHEGQHHKLGALLHMFRLLRSDPAIRYYAPWRDDPRPLDGLLQGVYAFVGITDFWRVHRQHATAAEASLAHFEFALWRRQAFGAAQVLAGSGRLTEHGRRFVDGLHATLASWQDDPVAPDIAAAAEAMGLDHHALWRVAGIRVDPALGAALSSAFQRGDPAPAAALSDVDETVVALPEVGWLDGRAVLLRHRLADPGAELSSVPVEGSTPADVDLVSGRLTEARDGYLSDLRCDPGDAHAWVGLGLTLEHRDPARRAILGRPELLTAMAAGRHDPLAAARWLGGHLSAKILGVPRPAGWRVT
jgi:HEXXH motif-containing protein